MPPRPRQVSSPWYVLGTLAVSIANTTACSVLLDWNGYEGGDDAAVQADVRAKDSSPDWSVLDSSFDVEAGPPPCGPRSCGGCCTQDGFCSGGQSAATCGVLGSPCTQCPMGLSCVNGTCSTAPDDASATCTVTACAAIPRCIPTWQEACCKSDQTCGCEILYPQGSCM